MSSRNYSGERAPPRGPALNSYRDDRHRSDRHHNPSDRHVDDEDYDSSPRVHSYDRDSGTRRNGDGAGWDRGIHSLEKTRINRRTEGSPHQQQRPNSTTVLTSTNSNDMMEVRKNALISTSESVPVKELSKPELVDALMHFVEHTSSRGVLYQERNSAKKNLEDQLEEIEIMAPTMRSFPTHMSTQSIRKTEAEKILKTAEEELDKVTVLVKEAAEVIASHITFKATPTIDNSAQPLQKRCLDLENKVKELEKLVAAVDQKDKSSDINDCFRDVQAKHHEVIRKIQTSEAQIIGKIQTSEAKVLREYQNLSEKHTMLEGQHRATRTDFDSTRTRLDIQNESVKKHEAMINISKQEMAMLQQQIGESFVIMKAKDNDIDQLTNKVTTLQKLLDTHTSSFESSFNDLNQSNHLERLSQLENAKTSVVELQNQHKTVLQTLENFQGDLSTLRDKVVQFEKAPSHTPSTPAPHVTPKLSNISSAAMMGMMQTKIRDHERDIKLLLERERPTKAERPSGSASRALSQDNALTGEELIGSNIESRLTSLEDSLKEMHFLSTSKTVAKMSPFSTAAQEHVELKRAFELYRGERNQKDQATEQQVEELKTEIQTVRRNMTTQEQIDGIMEKLGLVPTIQAGMNEFLQNQNGLAQTLNQIETRFDNRLNSLVNSQNGNTIAITQLNNRMANISSADLAKHMLGQLETFYPDVRKAETTISELRNLLSEHTTQVEKIKSQVTVLGNQPVRKQSPALTGNRATESLRQEVDALSKDQILLEAATKNNQTNLTALEEASTTNKKALSSLIKKVKEQEKNLDGMSSAFCEAVAELSVKVDDLFPDSNSNTSGLTGVTSTPTPSILPLARQYSAQETGLNGKKRKVGTGSESTKPGASTNGVVQSPASKRAKRTDDDNEDLELFQ
ncbi:hypothetical protein SBOR_9662 [Sclerotinia borealis F-4128]|uniref:Uncharacterized protein n=1 Tax=Sclerotinia borealis (strain F-4128) TaxID=1432307 RepID=W9C2N5_SCLBF|nr:hypothetical protein SBOR_9662 [Sclerotinia borealis F-4128]